MSIATDSPTAIQSAYLASIKSKGIVNTNKEFSVGTQTFSLQRRAAKHATQTKRYIVYCTSANEQPDTQSTSSCWCRFFHPTMRTSTNSYDMSSSYENKINRIISHLDDVPETLEDKISIPKLKSKLNLEGCTQYQLSLLENLVPDKEIELHTLSDYMEVLLDVMPVYCLLIIEQLSSKQIKALNCIKANYVERLIIKCKGKIAYPDKTVIQTNLSNYKNSLFAAIDIIQPPTDETLLSEKVCTITNKTLTAEDSLQYRSLDRWYFVSKSGLKAWLVTNLANYNKDDTSIFKESDFRQILFH